MRRVRRVLRNGMAPPPASLSPDSFGRPDGAVRDSWETFVPICPYLDLTTGFGWRVVDAHRLTDPIDDQHIQIGRASDMAYCAFPTRAFRSEARAQAVSLTVQPRAVQLFLNNSVYKIAFSAT